MDLLNNNNQKKKNQFTILPSDSTDGHGGFGTGVLNLNNITPVIINTINQTASIDMGALHARSEVEKRIKFTPDRDSVPNGKRYWLVWVTIDHGPQGPYYAGVTSCEMIVDVEIRRGYKSLPEHVNLMDKSLKRKIVVNKMDDESKQVLAHFLKGHNIEMWQHSSQELHNGLEG
jgi:hypothetical protein